VNLGVSTQVGIVSVQNRFDYRPSRLNGLKVYVGNSHLSTENAPCTGDLNEWSGDIFCGKSGQFVIIEHPKKGIISLCGVAIIAGHIGAPPGYWDFVASGTNINKSFTSGIEK
jgi:hypothetical protein